MHTAHTRLQVLQKTSLHPDLCKHFTEEFKGSVTDKTPHKQDYTGRAHWLFSQSVISQSDLHLIGLVSKAPRWWWQKRSAQGLTAGLHKPTADITMATSVLCYPCLLWVITQRCLMLTATAVTSSVWNQSIWDSTASTAGRVIHIFKGCNDSFLLWVSQRPVKCGRSLTVYVIMFGHIWTPTVCHLLLLFLLHVSW